MKSVRLNKTIRQEILTNIMNAYTDANPVPVIKSAQPSLHKAIYEAFVKQHAEEIKFIEDNVNKFPNSVSFKNYIEYADDKGYWKSIRYSNIFSENDPNYEENGELKVPCLHGAFINLNNPDEKIPAAIKKVITARNTWRKNVYKPHSKAVDEWNLDYRNYRQQIQTVLDGVTTTKQLLEVWPEVEKFLPSGVVNPSKIQLPSVNVATLNSALIK